MNKYIFSFLFVFLVACESNQVPKCDSEQVSRTLVSILWSRMSNYRNSFEGMRMSLENNDSLGMPYIANQKLISLNEQTKTRACSVEIHSSNDILPGFSMGFIISPQEHQQDNYGVRLLDLEFTKKIYMPRYPEENVSLRGSPLGESTIEHLVREQLDKLKNPNRSSKYDNPGFKKLAPKTQNERVQEIKPLSPCTPIGDQPEQINNSSSQVRCSVALLYDDQILDIVSRTRLINTFTILSLDLTFHKRDDEWSIKGKFIDEFYPTVLDMRRERLNESGGYEDLHPFLKRGL